MLPEHPSMGSTQCCQALASALWRAAVRGSSVVKLQPEMHTTMRAPLPHSTAASRCARRVAAGHPHRAVVVPPHGHHPAQVHGQHAR